MITTDKNEHAKANAQAWWESIMEMLAAVDAAADDDRAREAAE